MKTIFIESSVNSFENFHDNRWFEALFNTVQGTSIEKHIEEFSFHWWGASRSFILPWMLVHSVFEAKDCNDATLTMQDCWDHYLTVDAFKASLWKVAESAYISIYYAYENLVVSLINAHRKKSIRVTSKDFKKAVNSHFGLKLSPIVWNNHYISVTREARNCIVHRGGKVSPKLLNMKHQLLIDGEDLLISASDVRFMYNDFKKRVDQIVLHYS